MDTKNWGCPKATPCWLPAKVLCVSFVRFFDIAVVLACSFPNVVVILLALQIAVKQHNVEFVPVGVGVTTNHRGVIPGAITSTVTALAFVGIGQNLTNVKIDIEMSSTTVSPNLAANTEKIISYATVTFSMTTSKLFVIANVMFSGGVSATGTGRLYVSAAGGTCTTASTVVHTSRFAVAATANAGNSYTIFGLDTHAGTVGTFAYCFSLKSSAASTYTDHEMALFDASPASTTNIGP